MKKGYIYMVIGNSHKAFHHNFMIGSIVVGTGEVYESDPDTSTYQSETNLTQWVDVNDVFEIGKL